MKREKKTEEIPVISRRRRDPSMDSAALCAVVAGLSKEQFLLLCVPGTTIYRAAQYAFAARTRSGLAMLAAPEAVMPSDTAEEIEYLDLARQAWQRAVEARDS